MELLHEEVAQKIADLTTKSKSNFEISELIKILTKVGNKLIQETWKERNARIAAEASHLHEQLLFTEERDKESQVQKVDVNLFNNYKKLTQKIAKKRYNLKILIFIHLYIIISNFIVD